MTLNDVGKVLVFQEDETLYFDNTRLNFSSHISIFLTKNIYHTVQLLAQYRNRPLLVAGRLVTFCTEQLDFFRILHSQSCWNCCCLNPEATILYPAFQDLIKKDRLVFALNKDVFFRQIEFYFLKQTFDNATSALSSIRETKIHQEEYSLSYEEIQALLSA